MNLANTAGDSYADFWHSDISLDVAGFQLHEALLHQVNDAPMAVFFFIVGLETKSAWEIGELVDRCAALLPAVGAVGGTIVPALIHASTSFVIIPIFALANAGIETTAT